MSVDDPEWIERLIREYPEFRDMYGEIYELCRNLEEVMGMYSRELQELDEGTIQYMMDEMQEQIKEKEDRLKEKDEELKKAHLQIQEKEEEARLQIKEKEELLLFNSKTILLIDMDCLLFRRHLLLLHLE